MLVEDQHGFITQMNLERFGGVAVTIANRGDLAIELFSAESFDAVVLDLRLPVLDGFQILQAIQKIDPTVPVIILSAFGDAARRDRAKRLGAKGFFVKPPDYAKLYGKLSELMAERHNRRFDTLTMNGDFAEKIATMRRLGKLREQAARLGISTPPEVLTEIEDLEKKIEGF